MRAYDISHDEPAMNLAFDEALLLGAEEDDIGTSLRFWESPVYFAVVGVSQQVEREVELSACREDGIPVLRRCSAGGCVVQGPGCLNYSLVLDMASHPSLATIRGSYRYILNRIRDALKTCSVDARLEGISDLAIGELKFSGNAQRRKKRYLLHHGTLLYGMELDRLSRYLKEPAQRPAYRGERVHQQFVCNLDADPDDLKAGIRVAFEATESARPAGESVLLRAQELALEKYRDDAWNFRR